MIIKARFTSLMSTSLLNLEGIVYCCAWGDKCGMELILSLNGSIIFGVGGITHTFLIAINIETKKET